MRKGMGFAAGAFFGMFLVATCTTDTATPSVAGDMAVLPGPDLAGRDFAGFDLRQLGFDIAKADAAGAGSMVYTATCDKTAIHTVAYSTFTITYTYYLAEIAVAGLAPSDSPHLTATGCNNTYFGASGP